MENYKIEELEAALAKGEIEAADVLDLIEEEDIVEHLNVSDLDADTLDNMAEWLISEYDYLIFENRHELIKFIKQGYPPVLSAGDVREYILGQAGKSNHTTELAFCEELLKYFGISDRISVNYNGAK